MLYEVEVGHQELVIPFYLFHKNTGALLSSPSNVRVFKVIGNSAPQELAGVHETAADGKVSVKLSSEHFLAYSAFSIFVISDYGRSSVARVVVGGGIVAYTDTWVLFPVFKQNGAEDTSITPADVQLTVLVSYDNTKIDETLTLSSSQFAQAVVDPSIQLPYYYVLVPEKCFVPKSELSLYLLHPHGRSSAAFTVSDTLLSVDLVTAPSLMGVYVEFLDPETEAVVTSATTDAFGQILSLPVPRGEYIVRLSKSGLIFTNNNALIGLEENKQTIVLDTNFTVAAAQPDTFCRIYFRLTKPDGSAFANLHVYFVPRNLVVNNQAGVVKTNLMVKTDPTGYGEVFLAPGMRVVVHVEGTRLHEEFVVPDAPEANLFDLITFKDKTFDLYVADFDDAIRRTTP